MSIYLPIVKAFTKSALLLVVMLPFSLAADVYFMESGNITKLTNTHLYADDLHYRLLPTVKVVLESGKKGSIKKLKKGDDVNMKILTLDGKSYVDTIFQLPDQGEKGDSNTKESN